jgi:hypothetical protein
MSNTAAGVVMAIVIGTFLVIGTWLTWLGR